jgi:hypothetical protein
MWDSKSNWRGEVRIGKQCLSLWEDVSNGLEFGRAFLIVPISRLPSIPSFLTFLTFLTKIVAIKLQPCVLLRSVRVCSQCAAVHLGLLSRLTLHNCAALRLGGRNSVGHSATALHPRRDGSRSCAAPGQQRQQAPPTEMRLHSPWRRLACDRCRSQKLRCVRTKENDTSRPCTRCLRIGHPCFTSLAKPPGRTFGRLPLAPESAASSADAGSPKKDRAASRADPPQSLRINH